MSAAVVTASLFVELPPAKWRSGTHIDSAARPIPAVEASSVTGEGSSGPCEEISGGSRVSVSSVDARPLVQAGPEAPEAPEAPQRFAELTAQQQGMARHTQVHANHQELVRQNGLATELKMRQERQRWEQQQQQPQQQQQQQEQEVQNACQALPVGATVTSKAAARIDLAGGWTDTPPISYEAGGSVLNVAVTVSEEKPVVARCERIRERCVELVCEGREGTASITTTCSNLEDFTSVLH